MSWRRLKGDIDVRNLLSWAVTLKSLNWDRGSGGEKGGGSGAFWRMVVVSGLHD